MNKSIKLMLLLAGLIFWIAMIVISYKSSNVLLAAGAGILLGATITELQRNFGQIRKRAKRIGNPLF